MNCKLFQLLGLFPVSFAFEKPELGCVNLVSGYVWGVVVLGEDEFLSFFLTITVKLRFNIRTRWGWAEWSE